MIVGSSFQFKHPRSEANTNFHQTVRRMNCILMQIDKRERGKLKNTRCKEIEANQGLAEEQLMLATH